MITLAIDTSEARGSVAVRREGATVARKSHEDGIDYSGWLLPAVYGVLAEASSKMELVDLLAVSAGPGSFTGLRVGLTSVKAWAEVYGMRIVGVSRLEALARSEESTTSFVTACYDAQRGQLFAALYQRSNAGLARVGDEFVVSPQEFVGFVDGQAGQEPVSWISLDPEQIGEVETLKNRVARGDELVTGRVELAWIIGELGEERAMVGKYSDPVTLDANYVRRSDAEIFWKGSSAGVR